MAGRIAQNHFSCNLQHFSLRDSALPCNLPRVSFRFSLGKPFKFNSLELSTRWMVLPKAVASGQLTNTWPSQDVIEIWRNADAVCFDVDSTVCLDEGIDELADFCGAGEAVAELTSRAMGGSVPFEEALAARLSLFNPSLSQLHLFLEKRPPRISPGIHTLIEKLRAKETDVYLISGGFRQMIEPVAARLGIPEKNIFANRLLFKNSGDFEGFDAKEYTSRSGGKAAAVQHIRGVHNYRTLVMIGDGATDLEAKKPGGADLFICYGGVQLRSTVAAAADWVLDFWVSYVGESMIKEPEIQRVHRFC